jgi:hypothetical protein
MASSTSPDGIVAPTSTDGVAPLPPVFQALANSVQAAFNNIARYGGLRQYGSAAARNTAIPAPVNGQQVYRTDTGRIERYQTAGTLPAGWYPIAGNMPRVTAAWSASQGVTANAATTVTTLSTPTITDSSVISYNAGVFTFSLGGWWHVTVTGASDGADTSKYLMVTKGGTTDAVLQFGLSSSTFRYTISHQVFLASGDNLRIRFVRGTDDFIGPIPDGTVKPPAFQAIYMGPLS